MGNSSFFSSMIEQRLLDMHTAYLGKVLSISGNTAKIQPLGMYKQYGETAQKQAVVNAVIANSAKYKLTKSGDNAVLTDLAVGNTVLCVCCERDITDAKKGINSVPSIGHHSLSDSVVVSIM